MSRKKRKPEESAKHQLILRAAGRMFMTQGYSQVSMDALADSVPVSKRTLYNHFKDKKALFSAVMQGRCQLVFNKLAAVIQDDKSPRQTLTTIGKQFLGVVLEPDAINIYRTAITEAQHFPELGKLFYELGPKRSTAILTEYLRKLHQKGALHIPNPELAANTFLAMLINRIQMKCMLGLKKKVTAQEKSEIIRYVVGVFLGGQQAR